MLQQQFRLRDYEMSGDISKNSRARSILDGLNIRDFGDWETFVQRLDALVSSGGLRGIPPPQGRSPYYGDHWYLEEETGDTYFYREPGERNSAEWKKVDPFAPPAPEPPDNNALKLDLSRIPVGRMCRSDAVSLLTRLYILVGSGRVQEVPRPIPSAVGDPSESWFRDLQTGIVYKLVEGNGENDSLWERVPLNEFHAKIQ
jgi:hypothetical protein